MSFAPISRLYPCFRLRPTSPFIDALAAAAERRAGSPLTRPEIARVEAPEPAQDMTGPHGNPRR